MVTLHLSSVSFRHSSDLQTISRCFIDELYGAPDMRKKSRGKAKMGFE